LHSAPLKENFHGIPTGKIDVRLIFVALSFLDPDRQGIKVPTDDKGGGGNCLHQLQKSIHVDPIILHIKSLQVDIHEG